MKALILAAGYATRLYPLTVNKPKALLPVSENAVVLDLIVEKLEKLASVTQILIVTNHKYAGLFEEWLAGRESGKEIKIIDDGTTSVEDKRGAIGDLQFVIEQEQLQDDLFVLAGDNVFSFELEPYVDYFYAVDRDCLLVKPTNDLEELRSIGVAEVDELGRVTALVEKPAEPRSNIGVYALYLYKKETLKLVADYLEEGNSPDSPSHFPEWLVRQKDVRAYSADGGIYDIGTHEAYEEIRKLFAAGE
ncbi:nucleotidyltransferase family protein [Paenibacillus pinistramenti]|uniref:nucleotidyltransferase family protein n=1 Tax=Paenibacillus pinistramenti TaxID=1768003 RepID=UPI001107ED20|nr:nucleotidyltransferase family protein [Paenibacillus pinistramenti]